MAKNIVIFIALLIYNFVFTANQYEGNLFAAQQHQEDTSKTVEYTNLRLDYSRSKEYSPYNPEVIDIRHDCRALIKEGKFKEAIEKANRGLEKDKYNIQLLIILAASYRELGDIDNAEKYGKLWKYLVDSIMASGDGKSFKTAFKVISVNEEYAILTALGLERTKQILVEKDGSEFDVLTVKDAETDKEFELYFNVDIPKKWLDRQFSLGK